MTRGYSAVGLVNPKTPANVGGVMRAVGCYQASLVVLQGPRFKRWPMDTRQQWKHTPLIETDDMSECVPFGCVPVAVDLVGGARSLPEFTHPERAFYVFGPEDSTLGEKVLSWCHLRVMVPTDGCMNLAATVNVVLYDRMSKYRLGERK